MTNPSAIAEAKRLWDEARAAGCDGGGAVNIELSPGEWAGVMATLARDADRLHEEGAHETDADVRRDLHEQADDLKRIAGVIRGYLAGEHELPKLTPPTLAEVEADDVDATCQHVWTAEEVQSLREADADWAAKMRETHPDYEPSPRTYPVPGELCGADLLYWEGVPYRHYARWGRGDYDRDAVTLHLDDGKSGDGSIGEPELTCNAYLHAWAVPDDMDWS